MLVTSYRVRDSATRLCRALDTREAKNPITRKNPARTSMSTAPWCSTTQLPSTSSREAGAHGPDSRLATAAAMTAPASPKAKPA